MLELKATATCDRCCRVVEMDNVDDHADAEKRIVESGWCDNDDGALICEQCWHEIDALLALTLRQAEDAVAGS